MVDEVQDHMGKVGVVASGTRDTHVARGVQGARKTMRREAQDAKILGHRLPVRSRTFASAFTLAFGLGLLTTGCGLALDGMGLGVNDVSYEDELDGSAEGAVGADGGKIVTGDAGHVDVLPDSGDSSVTADADPNMDGSIDAPDSELDTSIDADTDAPLEDHAAPPPDANMKDAGLVWDGGPVYFCECFYDVNIQSGACHSIFETNTHENTFGGDVSNTSSCADSQAKLWCIIKTDAGSSQSLASNPCSKFSVTTIPTDPNVDILWMCCDL